MMSVNWVSAMGFLLFYFMCLSISLCIMCVQCTWTPEEGAGSLRLKFQGAVSYYMGAGNRT